MHTTSAKPLDLVMNLYPIAYSEHFIVCIPDISCGKTCKIQYNLFAIHIVSAMPYLMTNAFAL
jgi:hypothetical protein